MSRNQSRSADWALRRVEGTMKTRTPIKRIENGSNGTPTRTNRDRSAQAGARSFLPLLSADAARDYAGHRERYLSTNNPLLLHLKTAGRFERILKTKILCIDTNRCARRGDAFDLLSSMHDLRRDDCTYVNLSVHTVTATV